jgi:hypothetical protein
MERENGSQKSPTPRAYVPLQTLNNARVVAI